MLDHNVDINRPDSSRTTGGKKLIGNGHDYSLGVLNNAAASGDVDTFDYLVSRGADPSRSRALHHASRCRNPTKTEAMIHHLIDKHGMGVDEIKDIENLRYVGMINHIQDVGTPLNCAVINHNMAALDTLLRRGADATGRSSAGPEGGYRPPANTAIALYRRVPFVNALEPLFRAGASPSSTLIQAVSADNLVAARICLENGADLAEIDEQEREMIEEEREFTNGGDETPNVEWITDRMRDLFREWKLAHQ